MSDHPVKRRKKLIEVAIPLEAINAASAREKSIRHGHPSTLHLWWARRPLAAARAVIFCQMVDDPSAVPEEFPTEEDQENERLRLFALISELVTWENTTNEELLNRAREEIRRSWERCCEDNSNHKLAQDLFNSHKPPVFHDPFSGGGALPLEAKRLGLIALATDLNPVAVLINKVMLELPSKAIFKRPILSFENDASIASQSSFGELGSPSLNGIIGDFERASQELLKRVKAKCRGLYKQFTFDDHYFTTSPETSIDYSKYKGKTLNPLAWLWARTVVCPNPACGKHTPLLSTFCLSKKKSRPRYLYPVVTQQKISFNITSAPPVHISGWEKGYKRGNSGVFACAFCGSVTTRDYVSDQGKRGRLKILQTAIVLEGDRERVYVPADSNTGLELIDTSKIDYLSAPLAENPRDVWCRNFGLLSASDLFTPRQLVMLDEFVNELSVLTEEIEGKTLSLVQSDPNGANESDARKYSVAIATLLAISISRMTDYCSSLTTWANNPQMEIARNTFARQALPMTWDFAETNPFADSSGSARIIMGWIKKALANLPPEISGVARQADAATFENQGDSYIYSTDPPYYDNIGYADLSDFFYPWLRKMVGRYYPELFPTISSPKTGELVALPYRHQSKLEADMFFVNGMNRALAQVAKNINPAYPLTIYYAFKQSESTDGHGVVSTGWETFLEALVKAGFCVTSTWPIRTERAGRSVGIGTNALATSIVLTCAKKGDEAQILSKSEFKRQLRSALSQTLKQLSMLGIAPVDLAQAVIGPGMSIFSQAKAVLNADDSAMSVREALIEINFSLDELLTNDEGELDADSLFAVTFFESFGYNERGYDDAESLSRARNVSVSGVVEAGVLQSVAGKVRLLQRCELKEDWDPISDRRICVWEATQHLIKRLEIGGESAAAELLGQIKMVTGHGDLAANCRALAYRLFNHCEKTKQAEEAGAYNGLVIAWPELERLAASQSTETAVQASLI